jgi:hypothetical protein
MDVSLAKEMGARTKLTEEVMLFSSMLLRNSTALTILLPASKELYLVNILSVSMLSCI